MITINNIRKEKILLLLIMMLAAAPLAIAANDPGHDTLYVLKIGDSNVIGSINISENLTARFVRVTSKFFGDYLDILANGSASIVVPTTPSIQAASNTLYIDSTGNLYINSKAGTSSIVQIGDPATNSITLNVSGSIKIQGTNVSVVGNCPDGQLVQNTTQTGVQCSAIVANASSATNADTVDSHHVTATTDNRLVKHNGVNLADSGIADTSDAMAITIDSSENVGIRTFNPNTTLSVNGGGIEVNHSGIRHYRNVAQYGTTTASLTGNMKIAMPKNWSSTMMIVRIVGYDYSSGLGQWEVVMSGYNNLTGAQWYNIKAEIRGRAPFNNVRMANDGTYNVILLGNTSTTWNFPQLAVTDFIAGYSNTDGWGSGWTISNLSSETGIINISTPTIDLYTDSSGKVGIGTTTPTQKLDVNGSMNISENTYTTTLVVDNGIAIINGTTNIITFNTNITMNGNITMTNNRVCWDTACSAYTYYNGSCKVDVTATATVAQC